MIRVDLQYASDSPRLPERHHFDAWADAVLTGRKSDAEVVIRLVDEAESAALNRRYRHKAGPTNILSFPFEAPPEVPVDLLGDLVICAPVVENEAAAQGKGLDAHWAHMVVHGILHLLGYDHAEAGEAERMEAEEIEILERLGINNPYEEVVTP